MELKLEVVLSSSIKRKKPWPRFCWLGQEKECVFLLDDKRISEINMVSGRTKKRTPKLHPLLDRVVTMSSSHNGVWLCGVLASGELFLWNRDKDLLKSAAAAPEVTQIISCGPGQAVRLSLQVSGDGMHILLATVTGQVFLWECADVRDLSGVRDGAVRGHWAQIKPLEDTALPLSHDKEASQHVVFVKTEAMGDACLSAFVFTSGNNLVITCLKIQWEEGNVKLGAVRYSVQWASKTYPMSQLNPPCQPVKSRGSLVPAFSPDGQLLAIVLNQRQPKATQVLYVSTQNFVSVSSSLGGCGIKALEIPSKYIRSYWVGSISWSPNSLLLACVLKRGSLLMLARLGGLLTLTSSGCNVDFGPAQFLPLHPLVTYRPPVSAGLGDISLSSSSLSVHDVLRQRYSVTWHPRLLYLIVSDGYMATVMKALDRPSPAMFLKSLLKDLSRDLEKASQKLEQSQIHVRAWLESVSCLNQDSSLEALSPSATYGPTSADSVFSVATDTLPPFLQDQDTLGGTKGLLERMQSILDDDSDIDGPPVGSHVEDGGRLEFASMFDTLHALDDDTAPAAQPDYEKDLTGAERRTHRELRKIQSKLLTAWAFSISLGNAVEHRACLMKHMLCCLVRLAALLHLISAAHTGKKTCLLLRLIQALLSFLPWDGTRSNGPCCLGPVVELSRRLVRLLLAPRPASYRTGSSQLSGQHLSTVVRILHLVSDSIDQTYSLQPKLVWSSSEAGSDSQPQQLWSSDVHHVPLLEDVMEKRGSLHRAQPAPRQPSSRLFRVWQWAYKVTLMYQDELKNYQDHDGWEEEQQQLTFIMSQIQIALQATGEGLAQGPALLDYQGEHLFLCGSYSKSTEAWRSQICDESNKVCDRRISQEERLCLAHLYSLLYQYRLREAQELGDHMALLILQRAGHQKNNTTDSLPCTWLPIDLHSDAAYAVVQSLGRFMAAYFANQPLHILPPHHVAVLPPLHLPRAPSVGRMVPLCQEEAARAVRRQHLSEVWTVDYALDLLLLGGLLPEAVWLSYHLGDWKTAASLSLAYKSYCADHWEFAQLRKRELHLPLVLDAERIFQAELEFLLGTESDTQENRDFYDAKSFTDPSGGEDWDLLLVSMQEILKASVMAGVNVISSPLSSLLDTAKDLSSSFSLLVPSGLHLPAPPLYCPQPSANTQDPKGTAGQPAEVALRHKISALLQKLLLLLRSGRCCQPAAQWYITRLRRVRHILYKIKKKYSYPGAPGEEKALPDGLMKFVTHGGFFKRGPKKDGRLDPDAVQVIICFRELCALCWMLHVRDQLSISCRKYQDARQRCRDEQIPGDSEVRWRCEEALRWARRFQPFAHFLNAEEILQDILLSLVSELPPISLVADTLVQAFPGEEESVRVPLREKFNSLLQRLRQCSVLEEENEEANEPMTILIQDKRKHRRKHLGRLRRHLAPPELHLWEKEEEDEDRGGGTAGLPQFSPGTSLGTSPLTTTGLPTVCSDGDTAENTSEAISPKPHRKPMSKDKKVRKVRNSKNPAKIERAIREEVSQNAGEGKEKSSLPAVGTWEFEIEDDEYLNFLELFLSYELEKDDGGDSAGELPLLRSFSFQLRERELHSLTFDVLTTIHRRQRDAHGPGKKHNSGNALVFRAGSCFRPKKQDGQQTPSICNEGSVSRTNLFASSLSGLGTGKLKGLFSRWTQGALDSGTSPVKSAISSRSSVPGFSTPVEAAIELQQGLDPKLEARFPELGRLLEWMVRWADRRALLRHCGGRKRARRSGGGLGGMADEGVVIRVKASAPAVLTSLSLLEWRYAARFQTQSPGAHFPVPETQWTVVPVLQPVVVDGNLERESSVDTGYPGSANTPITGLDHNQGDVSLGSCTDEPEEPTLLRKSLADDQEDEQSFHDDRGRSSSRELCLDDLDVTPEKEGKTSGSEAQEVSSLVSHGNIHEHNDNSLNLVNADDTFTSISLSQLEIPHPVLQTPSVQPTAPVLADVPDVVDDLLPDQPVNPPGPTPAAPPPAASAAPHQPASDQSPQMRQRLGEDLFRLVMNINYMSMMEVLGASFSSLQLAQQSSSLAPPNLSFPHPYASGFMPPPNAPPVQTDFTVAQALAGVPPSGSNFPHAHNSGKSSLPVGQHQMPRNLSSAPSRADYQEMPPLSVQLETPGVHLKAGRPLIPSSQGLLVTTAPSNNPPCQVLGLKLLQARCPPLPQQSAQHYPPAQDPHVMNPVASLESHRPAFSHQAASKKVEDRRSLKRQLSFDHSPGPAPCSAQPQIQREAERPLAQEFTVLPSVAQAQTQGLRLLQLQQRASNNNNNNSVFPKLSMPMSRPLRDIAVPIGTPVVKLLHIQPRPKMISPMIVPSTQMSRLISVNDEPRRALQKVDVPNESTNVTSPGTKRSQRQRRREEEAAASAERPALKFRPIEKPAEEPVNADPAVELRITPLHDIGCFDPPLSGQRLLDRAKCTSAELHAYAATCYKPPECHDAFTNTDPAPPPILVDKAASASVSTSSGKSPTPQIHKVVEETPKKPQNIQDLHGHQFISVLDLDDKELHNDLPFRSPAVPPQPDPPSLPTAAKLHALSASVIRSSAAAPPAAVVPPSSVPDIVLQPITHTVQAEPRVDPEIVVDPSASPIFQAIKTLKDVEPLRNSASPRSALLSARLPEMDAHLEALQKMANSLEKDLFNSCMLVPPVSTEDVESRLEVKQMDRLNVPRHAWAPQSGILPEPNAIEEEEEVEEEERQDDEFGPEDEFCSPDAKSSIHHLTPADRAGIIDNSANATGLSLAWEDETLGQSGLLDTVKLLEELAEEGYICRTEPDSSPSQTPQPNTSRQDLQGSSSELQRSSQAEEERRELRTWMREKQRDRLATYRKERESLRERERRPFPITRNVISSSMVQANLKARDENEKLVLLEQFNQRARDACILAGFSSAALPSSCPVDHESSVPSTSSPIFGSPRRVHSERRSPESLLGQTEMLHSPWKAEAQGRPLDQHRRRLGLDRPATTLPRDRLSQVTRRGMITGSKRNAKQKSGGLKGGRQDGDQGKMQFIKRSPGATFSRRGNQTKAEDEEEVLSLSDDGDEAGASDMDWLEKLSTSEISCLSKIDWDAIERMVAEN